jgi:hypothetical protein
MIVSSPQLETAETVTVYRCLPLAQLPILPKTPTFSPGDAVTVLSDGVATTAQPEPPLVPPPPGLPFCAAIGIDNRVKQTSVNTPFIK